MDTGSFETPPPRALSEAEIVMPQWDCIAEPEVCALQRLLARHGLDLESRTTIQNIGAIIELSGQAKPPPYTLSRVHCPSAVCNGYVSTGIGAPMIPKIPGASHNTWHDHREPKPWGVAFRTVASTWEFLCDAFLLRKRRLRQSEINQQ